MNLKQNQQQKPWWNRPLFGEITFIQRLIGVINQQSLPDVALSLYNTGIAELEKYVPTIKMLENDNYNQEFLFYVKLKYQIENNLSDYQGLNTFVEILICAVYNIRHFETIQRIELDYREKSQRELYKFVEQQLNTNLDQKLFKNKVNTEIEKVISLVKNDSIKEALTYYKNALDKITDEQVGLKLLLLLKSYKLANYSIFNIVIDVLKKVKKQDLQDLQLLIYVAETNYEKLENVGRFIDMPSEINNPVIFGKIIQYMALNRKYNHFNYQFQQLINNICKWEKHYQNILNIRKEYPPYKYKLPQIFIQKIPAEEIYLKYEDYLSLILPKNQ